MGMDATVTWEGQRVLNRFSKLEGVMQVALVKGSRRGLLLLEDRVRTGTGIRARSGAAGLMGRLTSFAGKDSSGELDAAIGFRRTNGFPYELSQEYGAKAKPGKAMAIPISREARRVQSPRDMEDLVLIQGPSAAILGEKKLTRGSNQHSEKFNLIPHFVLVKSIPARLRFRENVGRGLPLFFREVIKENDKALEAL